MLKMTKKSPNCPALTAVAGLTKEKKDVSPATTSLTAKVLLSTGEKWTLELWKNRFAAFADVAATTECGMLITATCWKT